MISRTTLTVLILAISSASAQPFGYLPNGTPIFTGGNFVNGTTFIPSFNGTFTQSNGTTGTFIANPNTTLNGFNTFNGINGFNNFSNVQSPVFFNTDGTTVPAIGTNVLTGLSSLTNTPIVVNPLNPFGPITTTDGTFIRPLYNNFRLRGYRNADFFNNRTRYATGVPVDNDDDVNFNLPRVSGAGPLTGESAFACINQRCNDDYNPVCGNDNRTYRNQCQLECFGVEFGRDGACITIN